MLAKNDILEFLATSCLSGRYSAQTIPLICQQFRINTRLSVNMYKKQKNNLSISFTDTLTVRFNRNVRNISFNAVHFYIDLIYYKMYLFCFRQASKMKMSKVGNQTNSQDPQAVNSRVFVGNLNTFQCSKTDVERMFQRYGRLAGK